MTSMQHDRARSGRVVARCVRVLEKAAGVASLQLPVQDIELQTPALDHVLIEIAAAAVNPSDVKAATGLMPYAVFPRIPGRDYSGTVIAGPSHMIGRTVFGSSGDLGIRQNGSHATHLIVEAEAVVEVPEGVSASEAAGIGVPFVTAWEGFRRAGPPVAGDTVLVLGVNGKVGQAATQIATWRGARVIGVVRRPEPYEGHANGPVDVIDSATSDVFALVRDLTGGKGADIVFNTVGDPYYEIGTKSLAVGGRQIFIAAVHRIVSFDILAFYKGQHTYSGIDTISFGSVASGSILRELVPGFQSGHLKPFPIHAQSVYSLEAAPEAYARVMSSSRDRLILDPRI